jgi:hypothetical protein
MLFYGHKGFEARRGISWGIRQKRENKITTKYHENIAVRVCSVLFRGYLISYLGK